MTTGPFNDNIWLTRDVPYTYWFPGWDHEYPAVLPGVFSGLYQKVRPASQTSPIRRDGTRAPLPWVHEVHTQRKWEGTHGYVHGSGADYRFFGSVQDRGVIPLDPFPEHVRRRAALNLRKNANTSRVNLGVTLAEARKTAEMVGSTATAIARQVERFRRAHPRYWWDVIRRRASRGRLKDQRITDEYLKMCYGWTPLLGAIDGSAEALARLLYEQPVQRLTVRGVAKESDQASVNGPTVPDHLQSHWDIHYEHRQAYACTFSVDLSNVREFSNLGLTQPEQIVWELVPYSFVVDWFLPVGSWLESMSAFRGLSFREGTLTRSSRARATGYVKARESLPPHYQSSWCAMRSPAKANRFMMSRVVLLEPPGVELPELRNPLSIDKMAKGLALLVGAFR